MSSLALATGGSLVLWQLPVAWPIRGLAEIAWWVVTACELWHRWQRYRTVAGFCLYADGSVDVEAPDGSCSGGMIAAGTVSLLHVAWVRWRDGDGRLYAELIAGNSQERDDWRRFRVICRHVSAC